MGRSRAKIRVKPKKGKGSASKIRQKVKMEPYVGNTGQELKKVTAERDSLKAQLDSIQAVMKVEIKK